MSEFCRDLPLSVICAMLGLPEQDHDQFKNWLGGLKDTANIGAVIRAIPGVISVVRYLRRVSRPGGGALPDGLIAALRDAETDGQTLSEDELVSMIFLLFGAGQETTTHLIAGGLFALLSHEDQLRQLRSDPGLMPTCVEECLRYVSPVQMTKPRFATRDVVWQGRQFRRGDMFAGIPGGGKLRSCQVRAPSRFRHNAPPEPASFLRHRRAFLPWLSACPGGGRNRTGKDARPFSEYASIRQDQYRMAQAPRHTCVGSPAGFGWSRELLEEAGTGPPL